MAALRFFFYLLMKPATLGMAFLGIAGIFAPSTNPNSWWLPALSGLFMPAIIFANLYLLIFWAICKKWWIILPCVTIICNYNYFTGTFQSPWKKDILYTQENDITIASYNVNGFSWIARNVQYDIKRLSRKIILTSCVSKNIVKKQIWIASPYNKNSVCHIAACILTNERHGPILVSAYIVVIP